MAIITEKDTPKVSPAKSPIYTREIELSGSSVPLADQKRIGLVPRISKRVAVICRSGTE
jgi:hypothetical protein